MISQRQEAPAVTIVVACYNHERFVSQAVRSAFTQDHLNLRVIITDDASTDSSQQTIRQLLDDNGWEADLIFHDENRGICATFNEALARVGTPYVAFIAADDFQDPGRVAANVAVLEREPGASMVYGPVELVNELGESLQLSMDEYYGRPWPGGQHDDLFARLLEGNWIPAPSALSRTDMLRAVGGFDEALPYEDHDLWLRLARVSDLAYCPEPLVSYRVVPGSLSHTVLPHGIADLDVRLRMYAKHLGFSSAADEWLLPRLFVWAVRFYQSGGATAEVAHVLREVARRRPSPRAVAFATLTSLGLPWPRSRTARGLRT